MAHAVTDLLGRKGVAQVWQAWQHNGRSAPSVTRSLGSPIYLKCVLMNAGTGTMDTVSLGKMAQNSGYNTGTGIARAQKSQKSGYVPVYDAIAR